MTSSTFFKGFIAALIVALVGDMLWHNVLLAEFYNAKLMTITGAGVPGFSPFLIVLEVMASAVTAYFVLAAARKRTIAEGAFHGALLGFAMVGAVNFLNHAFFARWDTTLMSVDIAFGIILGAACGAAIILAAAKR